MCALTLGVAGAGATSSWTVQLTPNPVVTKGSLPAVSCSAASACTAVGGYTNSRSVNATLAARWDGSSWARQAMPNIAGGQLAGVSCPTGTFCVAVGQSSPSAPLAERWDGSSWTVTPTPGSGVLSAVSCPSVSTCIAVGRNPASSSSQVPLAERWNGTNWTLLTASVPSGTQGSLLDGVSCSSAAACTAVGRNLTGTACIPLAERWNGSSWTIQTTPYRAKYDCNLLYGVACPAANACTAVGAACSVGGAEYFCVTLAERWNGTKWTLQYTPEPPGAPSTELDAVSCPSTTTCIAVGTSASETCGPFCAYASLVEHWNGTSWTMQTTPSVGNARLFGVSCRSSTECTAAGDQANLPNPRYGYVQMTLAEHWDGSNWTAHPPPNGYGTTDSHLNAVSCASTASCTAVGNYINSLGLDAPLAESWHGTTWVLQTTRNPSGSQATRLLGVSCVSSTACTAVGYSTASSGTEAMLAERWNGVSWTIQSIPAAQNGRLTGVSCSSTTSCMAVGYSTASGAAITAAESWNGSAWNALAPVDPAGASAAQFNGVSCRTRASCMAVGSATMAPNAPVTLAEQWNGVTWGLQTTPNSGASSLNGVSCPTATMCVAVGSGGGQLLAEGWDGLVWTIQPTPKPAVVVAYFSGASCPSTTSCTAVGQYGGGTALAEGWNGSGWTIQSGTAPAQSVLRGVTCPVVGTCVAGGDVLIAAGNYWATLVERAEAG
ncbi:MAG: hypothetical protein E6J45_03130 [Chloroflexi bacterium]|nr:MAG: hypothetical protein E6J45_03130 [Chloroflexota bacterium]